MFGAAPGTVIFDGNQTMSRRSRLTVGICIYFAAVRARAPVPAGGTGKHKRRAATPAISRLAPVVYFIQLSTVWADQDIVSVPAIFGQQITGEKSVFAMTFQAALHFNPEEIFYVCLRILAVDATGPV